MSVLLRCPTCGTTQDDAGNCEACSDGEVRYFCTNHDVGVWLNGPVCGSCGAKFGDPPRKPPIPQEPSSEPDFARRPRRAEPEEPAEPEVHYEVEDAPWVWRPEEPRRPGFPLAGCLVRIVGLVFLLIAAAIIFLFLLFGGFIVN